MRLLRALLRPAGPAAYTQGQSPSPRAREYFYYIDHQGQLFLDDAKVKNFITCFKAEPERTLPGRLPLPLPLRPRAQLRALRRPPHRLHPPAAGPGRRGAALLLRRRRQAGGQLRAGEAGDVPRERARLSPGPAESRRRGAGEISPGLRAEPLL
ncbi:hypothetical protein KIL84_011143 [Mauremys mutica]|uniref:Uncharacterized protein n=1 Tax=Mauremys mutica TaxID=74926 RepID=A0A9D3XD32_9SAUR|nr:hypothetical protein KIL84_011143 [Mauremys mutica]